MKPLFRFTFLFAVIATAAYCGSNHSAPTQPGVVPTPTRPAPMTPTSPAAMTPTSPAAPTPTPAAMAHVVNVGQGGNNFVDSTSGNSTTTIRVGQSVMWTWVSGTHSTTSGVCCNPDGKWDSGIMSGGSFTLTFTAAGNFPYYCSVHGAAMTGTVMVTP